MSRNLGSFGDLSSAEMADFDGTPLNRSFNSAISNNSGTSASASSSKAVLAALRALQDKIRRLEAERAQATEECSQLRQQMKNLEIEADHTRQREVLIAQKNLSETRSAYDKLLHDKSELEIRLSIMEGKNRETESLSDQLHRRIRDLEYDKEDAMKKIKELEHENKAIELRIAESEKKEKGNFKN